MRKSKPKKEHIDAPLLTRWLVLLALKARNQRLLSRLWKPSFGLTSIFNTCIKVKSGECLAEAHALRFVSQHTSIPVPKLHCAFFHKGMTYIAMSRIEGQEASLGWVNKRSQESKDKILEQLRGMLAELRSVPRPAGESGICAVNGGQFSDCRLPTKTLWGPFTTTREFHEALVGGINIDIEYDGLPPGVGQLFDFYRHSSHDFVLTHGDLSSLNIMVRGDEVVGIVDWETAGWFPSYWEYTCAKNVNPYNTFWAPEIDHFLPSMSHELEMDIVRRKHFGDFW